MTVVRRLLLIGFVLVVPVAMVALLYGLTAFFLTATSRTIDSHILQLSSGLEYGAFLFVALLEVKNRW